MRRDLIGVLHKYAEGQLPVPVLMRVLDINRNLARKSIQQETTGTETDNMLLSTRARAGVKREAVEYGTIGRPFGPLL